MSFTRPQHLVETDWMAKHLDDPEVRLLECNVFLHPAPDMPGGFRGRIRPREVGGGAHPGRGVRRPSGRAVRSHQQAAVHDAAGGAVRRGDGARGRRRRRPRDPLRPRRQHVGGAHLVDAARVRLRQRRRAERRLQEVDGGRPPGGDRCRHAPRPHVHPPPAPGPHGRQGRCPRRARRIQRVRAERTVRGAASRHGGARPTAGRAASPAA